MTFSSASELDPIDIHGDVKSEVKSILGEKDLNKNAAVLKNTFNKPNKRIIELPIDIQEKEPEYLKDVLKLNIGVINFGCLYPGQICEHNFEIFNKNKNNLNFKIKIVCLNEKFNLLDEYVYSMRRTGGFEYNDNFLIVQAPWVKSNYKVAIKIPCVYEQEDIRGLVVISTEEFPDSIEIPLNTTVIFFPNIKRSQSQNL